MRGLFLSGLGVVYLCAFASLWTQVHGLIGSTGIAPVGDTLDWMEEQGRGVLRFPTLLWFDSSDLALHLLCGGGVALSLLVVLGIARLPCLALGPHQSRDISRDDGRARHASTWRTKW